MAVHVQDYDGHFWICGSFNMIVMSGAMDGHSFTGFEKLRATACNS